MEDLCLLLIEQTASAVILMNQITGAGNKLPKSTEFLVCMSYLLSSNLVGKVDYDD